jgi:hypothetical protein
MPNSFNESNFEGIDSSSNGTISDYQERTSNGRVFVGSDVNIFHATSLAGALGLYAKTKMQVDRAYTPTNMLKAASSYTGKKYKRGQFLEAQEDLKRFVQFLKENPRVDD